MEARTRRAAAAQKLIVREVTFEEENEEEREERRENRRGGRGRIT